MTKSAIPSSIWPLGWQPDSKWANEQSRGATAESPCRNGRSSLWDWGRRWLSAGTWVRATTSTATTAAATTTTTAPAAHLSGTWPRRGPTSASPIRRATTSSTTPQIPAKTSYRWAKTLCHIWIHLSAAAGWPLNLVVDVDQMKNASRP